MKTVNHIKYTDKLKFDLVINVLHSMGTTKGSTWRFS
jgi:hypothetical protein